MKVLITGGAGFIGTHLSRKLLRDGHAITLLDNFSEQIHGGHKSLSDDIANHVQLIKGDVRDLGTLKRALREQDAVFHLAAETGTGQSMYEIARYEHVNLGGTALLLEQIVKGGSPNLETIVMASSRAVYGEGRYQCPEHEIQFPEARLKEDMRRGEFEPKCAICGAALEAVATTEGSALHPTSFYGLTKLTQEQMVLMFGRSLGLRTFALRYQNVYGPGQSLNNPYTGLLAVFSTQARKNKPVYIFEDGQESRDFVYVEDVADASARCLCASTRQQALNVGSGERVTVMEVAAGIMRYFASQSPMTVNRAFREGDIRHNFADLTLVRSVLDYEPRWKFSDGLQNFLKWSAGEQTQPSRYEESLRELRERGMYHA